MNDPYKIIYKDESYAIVGACMKVHRALGIVKRDSQIVKRNSRTDN